MDSFEKFNQTELPTKEQFYSVLNDQHITDDLANYLDLTFIIESNNRLYTKLYDKRDDFDFHIVNFPFLSSNRWDHLALHMVFIFPS